MSLHDSGHALDTVVDIFIVASIGRCIRTAQ